MQKFKKVVKANSASILALAGCTGVVATAVITAKTVPKALFIIEQAEKEKGSGLTRTEKFDYLAPVYIPVAISCIVTIGCILGSNKISKNREAALLTAYTTLDSTFKRYRESVIELYGTDSDSAVRNHMSSKIMKKIGDDTGWSYDPEKRLFYEEFGNVYFESTMEDVLLAEAALNKIFAEDDLASLDDFYQCLKDINTSSNFGKSVGWSKELGMMKYNYACIEFEHPTMEFDDGMECTLVRFKNNPTPEFVDDYIW